jgi:carboxymethylenebutenolidase
MRIVLPSGTPAELAVPEDGEPTRGLVLFPDIGGLRPLFDDLVARLSAENGWAVIAPEPFPGREAELDSIDKRMAAMSGLDDERQLGDALAAADELQVEPVAVLGFCMGGMYALKATATGRFDKAVSFYGMIRVPEDWQGDGHAEPLDAVTSEAAAEVLAIVGTDDPYTPIPHLDELEATGATVVRYEDAQHGFVHDPTREAHRPEDAADAWARVTAFLDPANE